MEEERPDYSMCWRGSEEIASYFMDVILTNGGMILYQKYLERKAFIFAETAATDAVVSSLEMCFVAHDRGEGVMNENWTLEEEPVPGDVDSWARMYMPAKKRWGDGSQDDQATALRRAQQARMRQANRGKNQAARTVKTESSSRRPQQAPPYPIPDETEIDPEEEQLREHKALERQRLKEKEQKAVQAEKVKEQERLRVQALHEQMERCPHTFDTEGNIIWIEEPRLDRLPKVQETFPYNVKKDKRMEDSQGMALTSSKGFQSTGTSSPKAAPRPGKKDGRGKKGKKKAEEETDFTDSFAKLQHGQPPILEVMNMKAGVVLHANGRQKAGGDAENPNQVMSRKEYLAIAEQEEAGGSVGDSTTKSPPPDAPVPPVPPVLGGGGDVGGAPPAAGGDLPPLQGRVPGGGSLGASASQKQLAGSRALPNAAQPSGEPLPPPPEGKINVDPAAPPPAFRSKRDAIGYMRPPRFHTPSLGGQPSPFTNSVQPPIGATMGHGLLHSGSAKDNYFFPLQTPEPPSPLLRSSSDPSLRSKDRSILSSIGGSTPKGMSKQLEPLNLEAGEDADPRQGTIIGDKKNPAYKVLIQALGS